MWNTHPIRKSSYSGGVTGIPNEPFYVPGIQGICHDLHSTSNIILLYYYTILRFIIPVNMQVMTPIRVR